MGCCNSTEVRNVQFGEEEFCFMSLAFGRLYTMDYYCCLGRSNAIGNLWRSVVARTSHGSSYSSCSALAWYAATLRFNSQHQKLKLTFNGGPMLLVYIKSYYMIHVENLYYI